MGFMTRSVMVVGVVLSACTGNAGESADETRDRDTALAAAGYHYTWRDLPVDSPPGYYSYDTLWLTANREVLGVGSRCEVDSCTSDLLKLDLDGNFSVVARDFLAHDANQRGDVGGGVLESELTSSDLVATYSHAAIVHADGTVERLPALPNEIDSYVTNISDGGTVLVSGGTLDPNPPNTFQRFHDVLIGGERFPIELSESDVVEGINDRGEVTGTLNAGLMSPLIAFRYDAPNNTQTQLTVKTCYPTTRGFGINQRGDVLGDFFPALSEQHLGTWNEENEFSTVSTEYTTSSSTYGPTYAWPRLTWNEAGLIVLSWSADGHTYLFPEAGRRLDLAALVDGALPPRLYVPSVNEHGDFLALSLTTHQYAVFLRAD
jgi:hypothetical protein